VFYIYLDLDIILFDTLKKTFVEYCNENFFLKKQLIMFSENGINNISSPQFKDNNFISHENSTYRINNYNNNNNINLNSYAKSTTNSTISSNASSSILSSANSISPTPTSPTSFAHQFHILIPNYDDLIDTIRNQQPRAGGSGMQNDRRNMNMMNDRRMNSMMMDRQMVSVVN
jgi:hypothetical protein